MLADARFAVAQEPAWSPWRDTALWELAEAHLLTDQVEEARTLFAESSAHAQRMNNADSIVICETELALLAMEDDDWGATTDHLELALTTIEALGTQDYVLSLLAFAGAARRALHDGDLTRAHLELGRAMRARPWCSQAVPFIAVRLRLQLARTYVAMADVRTARHLLREIDDIVICRPNLGTLIKEIDDVRSRASAAIAESTGASPLTPAELRLLPYLQTHLTFLQIADRVSVSRNTIASQARAIYRKLGVSSRHDAVLHATTVGLLGG
jgi:LuxR family maltose regulon positive regulatory protein